jgi:hypothetical protein
MTIDLPATVASVDASYLGAAAVSDQEKTARLAAAARSKAL